MLAVIGSLIATFRNIDSLMRRFKGRFTHNGFGMSAWDYAGLAVAAGALLAIVVPLYRERKKHERTQKIFAPSLREELDRGPCATRLRNTPGPRPSDTEDTHAYCRSQS